MIWPGPAPAQPLVRGRVDLSMSGSPASRVDSLRLDLTDMVIYGASRESMTQLTDRCRTIDTQLGDRLNGIDEELRIQDRVGMNAEGRQSKIRLQRERSLTWLVRIELSSLQSECYPVGSADAVSVAAQTIRLIERALTHLPTESVVRSEVDRLLIQSHLQAGNGWAAETVIGTVSQTDSVTEVTTRVLEVRVDLANGRTGRAGETLREFYGPDPLDAVVSVPMDLAYLQYLNRTNADDRVIGDWIDLIEKRGGMIARRRAETMWTRTREASTDSDSAPQPSSSDPRLLRADARYYVRTGKPLPAAISFARAAVQDDDSDRSIASAVDSAAILGTLSKYSAAAELLMQIARRHPDATAAADLVLMAASLANQDADATPAAVQKILRECMTEWSETDAANKARDALIAIAVGQGDDLEAALLATQVPAMHWSSLIADRCRTLWYQALTRTDDPDTDLQTMADALQATASRPEPSSIRLRQKTAEQLRGVLQDGDNDPEVPTLPSDSPLLNQIASLRRSPSPDRCLDQSDWLTSDSTLRDAVRWRLQRDIDQHPNSRQIIAACLLELFPEASIDSLRWRIMAGPVDDAIVWMRRRMSQSRSPGEWLRAAAETLSRTRTDGTADLRTAASLWSELADGLPRDDPSGIDAEIHRMDALFRSGDRDTAAAEAELMLLTRPPRDEEQRKRVEGFIR